MSPSKLIKAIGCISTGIVISIQSYAQAPTAPELMSPLLPVVTCDDSLCQISLSGVFNGRTLISDPLSMPFSVEDNPHWQPRSLSEEALKINGDKAPHGWRIGDAEQEMEILLTPLTELGMEDNPLLFMVEQRAGFEHVGRAYHFMGLDFAGKNLKTIRKFGPNAGPQPEITYASTYGVRLLLKQYNPETGDFDDVYEQYEWYSGAESVMLGSEAEMEEIYAQEDILMNEPQ